MYGEFIQEYKLNSINKCVEIHSVNLKLKLWICISSKVVCKFEWTNTFLSSNMHTQAHFNTTCQSTKRLMEYLRALIPLYNNCWDCAA